ncbi:MAG: putative C-S lyase [Acidobacteria bacterium]|nr:putative C-S lyase [Acidobacteriota bacterium]
MSLNTGLDRRAFLKSAGMTALAGAVGSGTAEGVVVAGAAVQPEQTQFDFDTIYDRIGTDCSKWDAQIAKYGRDKIEVPMGTADQDFRIAPVITRALQRRIEHENYGYLTIPASYVESIVNWNKRRHGFEIDPDLLLHSDGVHPAIISTLRAFCPPGSKVLVQAPVYNGFYTDIRVVGCQASESPMTLVNGRYAMNFDDLERRIDHDTHALILCNPQNPTGNVWSRENLMRLGDICTRRRVVVLSDEIHCDFVNRANTYTPYATLEDEAIVRNSITYKSASKSFNLSAMKVAYMFSTNADYIARIKRTGQHRQGINTLGVVAAQAAYDDGEEWQKQVVDYLDGTLDYVESFVNANMPLVKVVKPQGTYLAWLDVSEVVDRIGAKQTAADASDREGQVTPETIVQRYLVEHAHVLLNTGSSYGVGGAGHMRMNIATSRQLVALALTNMAQALAQV